VPLAGWQVEVVGAALTAALLRQPIHFWLACSKINPKLNPEAFQIYSLDAGAMQVRLVKAAMLPKVLS
jgi:hypothetical protein